MASSVPVDMELKKAFQEQHAKVLETTQKLKFADYQIESLKRANQHTSLTRKEVSAFPESTRMYKQLGRLFLHTEKTDMLVILDDKKKKLDGKITELENSKKYLERSMKESEENLRELVASKQKGR